MIGWFQRELQGEFSMIRYNYAPELQTFHRLTPNKRHYQVRRDDDLPNHDQNHRWQCDESYAVIVWCINR